MQFRSESKITHPRDKVFAAYRDRLGEVVAYIDDIAEVNVLSREEDGDVVTLHNEWVSDQDIPAFASSFLKPEHLRWDDYATWDASEHKVDFEIKTRAFTDAVRCRGTNRFVPDGDHTRVVLEGTFEITGLDLPGVPKFLAKRVIPKVEKFIVALIQPNLEKTNQALGTFLDHEQD